MKALVVEVRAVEVRIDGHPLLEPTSLDLRVGESLAVRGANGAGKTTLLNLLVGLRRPTSGSIRMAGVEVDERDARFRRLVSGLVGRPPIARDLTLAEHLALVAASWGAGIAGSHARADELLEEFALPHLAARFPHELSSGQSQLFALALTLARPADLVVIDEPEQRLDPDRLALVAGSLRRRVDDGTALVIATHSSTLADAVSDRTITLTEPSR